MKTPKRFGRRWFHGKLRYSPYANKPIWKYKHKYYFLNSIELRHILQYLIKNNNFKYLYLPLIYEFTLRLLYSSKSLLNWIIFTIAEPLTAVTDIKPPQRPNHLELVPQTSSNMRKSTSLLVSFLKKICLIIFENL